MSQGGPQDPVFKVPYHKGSTQHADKKPKHSNNNYNNNDPYSQVGEFLKSLEFKRDIEQLNTQLKEKLERLKKVSFELMAIETRLRNYCNTSTLEEAKALSKRSIEITTQLNQQDK
ncbi:hypothetical protein SAMD00019534_003540 [Acytostelium subglobosum LB1]|uniref:hypothetical protein n=1 Tax=Acytostelium subglobosum LB1 TaxID=1410327 RepID=UPI0006448438|nr:hypothetical protein SAMD00019534_003540 [Acytostelium subglobosum LB1]GAM17179.1 hypothetical protein SAMD00019534_003540 [Acytostelium subglobosum LB1]|eukprot:XP_012759241.1 hypothetical protein SAMD00019534_003540 [Acytostelium subglobosum LB1]